MIKILGVIPARGGSKGIPRKNLYPLAGYPLIYYSIFSAKKSRMLTEIIVTTDDEEIKDKSIEFGANVPFMRPPELSTDMALAVPTIKHAVLEMERINNIVYDYVIMLQPTAPLRTARHIDESLSYLISSDADSIISVVDVDNNHPFKMKVIKDNLLFDYQKSSLENPPRQSLPKIYIVNGAIYATKRNTLINGNTFKGEKCLPYIMTEEYSVNIDNLRDFYVAEYYLKNYNNTEWI
ncbi:MAG: acylneuraminate cytidylyltransferase family protein [Firmicutes bacterium]|nr:acylneuraminate cytidylyltransferase family protein [Bacillota bacterium]